MSLPSSGQGGSDSRGFMVLSLADWADRSRSQQEIVAELNGKLRGVVGIRAFAIQPNSLGIRGAGQGLSFAIVGNDYATLAESARDAGRRDGKEPAPSGRCGWAMTRRSRSCSSRWTAPAPPTSA